MAAYDRVALLRAVNVGGRQIAMADLRALFLGAGFSDAKTLLQSGNVVFAAGRRSDTQIEGVLEAETEKRFGFRSEYFVRDRTAMRAVVDDNPFYREAKQVPGRLVVLFLKEAVAAKAVAAFAKTWSGPEAVRGSGKHLYVYYPDGQGRSKLKLPWLGTARNWNTVLKLFALLE
jgi:uncharacterized protein (DUF1697 family)